MSTTLAVRKKNRFDPESKSPFKLSRSKIELFCECPRCFYLDVKIGISRPPMLPFTLNNAVDELLKREFDQFRKKNEVHPLIQINKIDAKLFDHPKLDEWRENFKGITFLHSPTNFIISGAVDDLWVNSKNELIVVDYKATSKEVAISSAYELYPAYKRQMEIYQWIFSKNGFEVSDTGIFVYCNGLKNKADFRRHLEFQVNVIKYQGNANWVEGKIQEIHQLLTSDVIPEPTQSCEYCKYAALVRELP